MAITTPISRHTTLPTMWMVRPIVSSGVIIVYIKSSDYLTSGRIANDMLSGPFIIRKVCALFSPMLNVIRVKSITHPKVVKKSFPKFHRS